MDRKHGTRMRRQRTTFVSDSWTAEVMLVAGFSICFLPRKKKRCNLHVHISDLYQLKAEMGQQSVRYFITGMTTTPLLSILSIRVIETTRNYADTGSAWCPQQICICQYSRLACLLAFDNPGLHSSDTGGNSTQVWNRRGSPMAELRASTFPMRHHCFIHIIDQRKQTMH